MNQQHSDHVRIVPSILAADFTRLGEEIEAVALAGADALHVDVMDGHFVPNLTLGPMIVRAIAQKTKLPIETHLMIESPEKWIETYAKAGASLLYVHVEASVHLHRLIQQIRDQGIRVGVSLNPATPLSSLEYMLDQIDSVLIMTVNPGFGGQTFIKSMIPKISTLRQMIHTKGLQQIEIAVDGGIDAKTALLVRDAGASVLVAGTSIFSSSNYGIAISQLRKGIGTY